MKRPVLLLLMLLFAPAPALAACTAPAYRQFDFFVGRWRVTDASGKVLGFDTVRKILGGCVVYEEYHDASGGGVGIGLSGIGPRRGAWHQDFMTDDGFVLALDGSFANRRMTLIGTDYQGSKPRLNRGIWTVHGSVVEELWERSTDGGKTWATHFHGWFHPLKNGR